MEIIKFSAMWCPACLIMNKRINDVNKNYNFKIVEYDYDLDYVKKDEYNIENILPVIIFSKNNCEVKRLTGELSVKKLEEEFKKVSDSI